jgi:hypothetical protein
MHSLWGLIFVGGVNADYVYFAWTDAENCWKYAMTLNEFGLFHAIFGYAECG